MKPFYVISGFVAFLAALISVVVYFTGAQNFEQLLSVIRGEPIQAVSVPGRTVAGDAAAAPNPATIELEYWHSISSANNASAYSEYLRKFPHGQFATIAKQKIEELNNPKPSSPPTPVIQNPFMSSGSDTATPFHSDVFEFDVTVPAHWTQMALPYDPNNVRVRLMAPKFLTDQSNCVVTVKDVAELSKFSQQDLNASVDRGEAMDVIRRDAQSLDENAVFSAASQVDLGEFKGQKSDVVLINKQGVRMHLREIVAFVPGRLYSVACAAPETVFAANQSDFQSVLDSFRVTGH